MRRPALDTFVAPARRAPALWRTMAGALLIVLIYGGMLAAALGALVLLFGRADAYRLASDHLDPATPAGTLTLLATFVAMGAAPMIVVHLLHHRGAATLFGRAPRVLRDFVACACLVGGLYALTVAAWSQVFDAVPGLAPSTWLMLLPLTLLGLLVQTGAEEVVFRGYLVQQLAARFRSPLMWLVLPSVLFGLVHYVPAASGGNAWILVIGAALFGLFAADLTAQSGSLGAAWGFHFANNVMAMAVLATDGTITGVALYLTPYAADAEGPVRVALLADYAMLTAAWGLCRMVVRR